MLLSRKILIKNENWMSNYSQWLYPYHRLINALMDRKSVREREKKKENRMNKKKSKFLFDCLV